MSNKAYFAKEIKQRSKELDRPEDALCIGLTSLSSYSSSARSSMLTQHLVQALVPNHPEIPAVCTSYEQMFGHFSTGYLKTDSKLKVIKKIVKHEGYVYTLVVYDPKKDEYDIINRKEVRNMAESYGYQYNNECIDSYKEGDTIKKDTMLYRSPCIDKHENFMYGVNLNTMYTVSQETIEDSVVISASAAKKLATTKVDTCEIPFNDNDIFLNLYGDNETFKAFPDIGEKIKRSVLCATRRKNKVLDQLNLKNSNLKKIFPNDDIFQLAGNYKVVDIDIWSNKTIDDIPNIPAYDQLRKYFGNIINYYQEVYDIFMEIKESGSKYSKELSTLYAKARDFLDPGCRYVDEDKMFSNMVIEFTLMKKENIKRGCKICGRYQILRYPTINKIVAKIY